MNDFDVNDIVNSLTNKLSELHLSLAITEARLKKAQEENAAMKHVLEEQGVKEDSSGKPDLKIVE